MSRSRAIVASTILGAAAAVLTANVALAQGRGLGGGFGRRHDGRGLMIFPMLLLIGLAVVLIVLWRGRHLAPTVTAPPVTAPPSSPTLNAQAILADRLARGEISPDDYRAAVSVLREVPPPPVG